MAAMDLFLKVLGDLAIVWQIMYLMSIWELLLFCV